MFFKPDRKIGIMALQGSFAEHAEVLGRMDYETQFIRSAEDVEGISACILPGGESTTLMKLLASSGLDRWLVEAVKGGLPVYGTCAGMIILAELGLIDIEVERNAYGPQLFSFEAGLEFDGKEFPGVFIRAPKVADVGQAVEILAKEGETPVLVRQENVLAGSFHPELTDDERIHEFFVEHFQK